MSRSRARPLPFETEIVAIASTGSGLGLDPRGKPVRVRWAAPHSRVLVQPGGKEKGEPAAQRMATVRPAAGHVEARCASYRLCGGCKLQEVPTDEQRAWRHTVVQQAVLGSPAPDSSALAGVTVHPPVAASPAWGYRNRIELSFGARRYLNDADHRAQASIEGRFLGFHAAGRFDRIVDLDRCEIVDEDVNRLIAAARTALLRDDGASVWDVRTQSGALKYLQLRHAPSTGELLIALFTPVLPELEPEVERLADALFATPLERTRLVGFEWVVDDGVADVARGETRRTWGRPHLEERLGDATFRISRTSFFQTSTEGANSLFTTVGEALGEGGTLLDLYCGAGSIGLFLAKRFDRIVGIEVVPEAVEDARHNARHSGIQAEFFAAKVEEVPELLQGHPRPLRVVVDPPRAGLHPDAAKAIAALDADTLVYVACNPASLGRDRAVFEAAGWRLTDLWTVDLFPHTAHVEAVARFVRRTSVSEPPTSGSPP
jgi:23S rRNA (uracil1939-C5)-methyltransferase